MTKEAEENLAMWKIIRNIAEFAAKQPNPPKCTEVLVRHAHSEVSFYEHIAQAGEIANRRAKFRVVGEEG